MKNVDFSIIIPTLNGEKTLHKLLKRLEDSSCKYNNEIIIIDSDSSDRTISIVKQFQKKFANISLICIKKAQFNHGLTRNLGVRMAKGRYVFFLSQDAIPINNMIFDYCISDFKKDKKITAVYGKHIPYKTASVIQQIEATRDFDQLDRFLNKDRILIQNLDNQFIEYNNKNFFLWFFISNVCSCYKKDYLLSHPFPKIDYGEDFFIGRTIIKENRIKIYDSRITVRHSHSLNLKEYCLQELAIFRFHYFVVGIGKKVDILRKARKIFVLKISLLTKIFSFLELIVLYLLKLCVFIYFRLSILKKSVN